MGSVSQPRAKVVILGGGPGGYEAALVAAQLGAEVTVSRTGRPWRRLRAQRLRAVEDADRHVRPDGRAGRIGRARHPAGRDDRNWPGGGGRVQAVCQGPGAGRGAVRRRGWQAGSRGNRGAGGHGQAGRPAEGHRRRPGDQRGRRADRHRRAAADAARRRPGRGSRADLPPALRSRRAARRARRRRLRGYRRRVRQRLPGARLAGHARLIAGPGAAARGRGRRGGGRGSVPAARDDRARPVQGHRGQAHRRMGWP